MPLEIQKKVSLASYTSWRVGGEAEYFCLPSSKEEVAEALEWAREKDAPVTVIGGGSNILISDKGVKGLVVCLKTLSSIEDCSDEETFRVRCGAGALKMKVMRKFLKAELSPALFLSGLPGDVAGGVVMNAGVSEDIEPREFVEIVESFKVLRLIGSSFVEKEYKNSEIEWAYRKSMGWEPGVITEVTLAWPLDKKEVEIKKRVKEAQELRSLKQPLGEPSCGSVFRNPYDDVNNVEKRSSGYLIEKSGMKGYQYGGAEVSRKHANFIVNKGEATALDIHCAISTVREKVKHEFNVELETEVRYIGDWEGLV
ncbi:MAG: UDP-N-acetylmuramate dehydrogenase [Bdellovibrionales bacterium]